MNSLLLLAAPAVAAAAPAQTDEPSMTGLWQGNIGSYPVVACLETDRFAHGSYYYRSRLIPIGLWHDEDTNTWSEGSSLDDDTAIWSVSVKRADELTGKWRKKDRELPIRLTRLEWSKDGDGGDSPCHSVEFQAPRAFEPAIRREAKATDGFEYEVLTFNPPAHFEGNAVDTFAYTPEQPGDQAILERLRSYLPTGRADDDFMQCMAGATGSLGGDGYVSHSARPAFVNAAFVSSEESHSLFCGGAHPSHWQDYRVFDRDTGEELDLKSWFRPSGFAANEYGSVTITPELRSEVMKHWPEERVQEDEGDLGCRDLVATMEFWGLGLVREGVAFLPSVPHVATVCAETMVMPWDDAAPFLSADGAKARRLAAQD